MFSISVKIHFHYRGEPRSERIESVINILLVNARVVLLNVTLHCFLIKLISLLINQNYRAWRVANPWISTKTFPFLCSINYKYFKIQRTNPISSTFQFPQTGTFPAFNRNQTERRTIICSQNRSKLKKSLRFAPTSVTLTHRYCIIIIINNSVAQFPDKIFCLLNFLQPFLLVLLTDFC